MIIQVTNDEWCTLQTALIYSRDSYPDIPYADKCQALLNKVNEAFNTQCYHKEEINK